MSSKGKVLLAYSGGLDTSCILAWLIEQVIILYYIYIYIYIFFLNLYIIYIVFSYNILKKKKKKKKKIIFYINKKNIF